jgi:alkyl hydroperoxide reductase subunit AhpF
MAITLEVYVQAGCIGCDRARYLAQQVSLHMPATRVRIIDLNLSKGISNPEVFAVPTFVVNGAVRYLGNPDLQDLLHTLQTQNG